MKPQPRFRLDRRSPRLWHDVREGKTSFWTEALADPAEVYGERVHPVDTRLLRQWDPYRSKLAAALVNGWATPIPQSGERWLYLGAATGTTASHVADLVGPEGGVFAIEKSARSFLKLLALARRYPNLFPILGDAKRPREFLGLVPPVDGVYVDLAQPDQVEITREISRWFLKDSGAVLLALKTASMGRDLDPMHHLRETERVLRRLLRMGDPVRLEPFHRRHFLLGGVAQPALVLEEPTPAPGHRAELRR
jgi:fibrillarin-like pre-rRNA processing protein